MRPAESFSERAKPQIDLRTGQPYANLIHGHRRFASTIADYLGVDATHVLPTAGATGAIEAVRNHVFRNALKTNPVLLTVCPGYWRARESFQGCGFAVVEIKTACAGFKIVEETLVRRAAEVQPDVVYLSLPNNPTGAIFNPALIVSGMPATTAVIFDLTLPSRQLNTRELAGRLYNSFRGRKLFLVGSTSKSHNTAEHRIGWAIATRSEDADQLNQENRNVVSSVAVEEACRTLRQGSDVHTSIAESFQLLKRAVADGAFELVEPPTGVQSSYALIRLQCDREVLRNSLGQFGIAVMWGTEFGLSNDYLRLEMSQPENVEAFTSALTACLQSRQTA